MKRLVSLVLALALLLSITAAVAEVKRIDGLGKRNIKIKEAGLNASAEEMIEQGFSPTTGRPLDSIQVPEGYVGTAFTGIYQPIMVQISNAGGGVHTNKKGEPATAPINAKYADVVYEACQANGGNGGSLTRFSMLFSDVIPDIVGFVRSTRLTHVRIRQEWDCAFCTSGWLNVDVKPEWKKMGVRNPEGAKPDDPGLVYNGSWPKVWAKYVYRLYPAGDANSEVFELANIVQNIVPKDHVPANHTWKYTDEVPEGGDDARIVYVVFGGGTKTDSRLEYDEETNTYLRYVQLEDGSSVPFREQRLVNTHYRKKGDTTMVDADVKEFGEQLGFTNVIVQQITMKWKGSERPDPVLTGSGNADYFIGGKHYEGVWKRKDFNDRTVFYGKDGNEIELMRGKTLIVLMDYKSKGRSVKYE